jgi:hypothetical protein
MQKSLFRELRMGTSLLENGMVELTITDTGSGLTDDMRERLFLPYFSTKQRGTGLGLAIAAKIIQEHQGTIRAEKNEPAGAKFIVELRVASTFDSDPDTSSLAASPFAAAQNGNYAEAESAEAQTAETTAPAVAEAEDDLASIIAQGPK